MALVIGGASGIGHASARALAARGHRLALADLSIQAAEQAREALDDGEHRAYAVDVASEDAVAALFAAVETECGPIAVLANCAGVGGFVDGKRPTLADTDLASWNGVFEVNAAGMFLCVREMFRRRAASRVEQGRIILIGSMAAQDGGKNSPPAYVASKGAVHALVKTAMAEAAALGVTINCVAPGVIDTPLLRAVLPQARHADAFVAMPLGRAGTPDEVAAVVAFLASLEASFVTGACFDANGGVRLS